MITPEQEARIDAWVEEQLAKPEAQQPITPEQVAIVAAVLANQPDRRTA